MRDWRDDFERYVVRDEPLPDPDDWPDEPDVSGDGARGDHYDSDYDCPESED